MSDLALRKRITAALSTKAHRLEQVYEGDGVSCRCGHYEGASHGNDAGESWRTHLIDAALDAIEPPHIHNAPRASGTGLEAAVRPETPTDAPTRLSAAPDGAETAEYHEHVAGDRHEHPFNGPHSHGGVSALSYPPPESGDRG